MLPPIHVTTLPSPLGNLTLAVNGNAFCGLYFPDHRHPPVSQSSWKHDAAGAPRFAPARAWLDRYFAGAEPDPLPSFTFLGGTPFQRRVWESLRHIPPGETRTYAAIARETGAPNAVRAVAAAIGRNPISILVPCHRVLGSRGDLTGYAGGLERKRWLLNHEASTLTHARKR